MSTAFDDLRRVMRNRLQFLNQQALHHKRDAPRLEIIHRERQMIHCLWLDFLRIGPERENSAPMANVPPDTSQ